MRCARSVAEPDNWSGCSSLLSCRPCNLFVCYHCLSTECRATHATQGASILFCVCERLWAGLNGGVSTLDEVRKLFAERGPDKRASQGGNSAGTGAVEIESACVANETALRSFNSSCASGMLGGLSQGLMGASGHGSGLDMDPVLSAHKQGKDTLLFHGTSEAAVANIQATGTPSLKVAADGMLGRRIYGAPDPRKSLSYCRNSTNGKFMVLYTTT